MERPRPGSHFARARLRSRTCARAQEHNNCVRCARTCVHKRLLKASSVRVGVETPGGWGEGPRQRMSLFIRRWKHTHTCTHTRVHHVNATVGYADDSADCAHREAAAEGKGCIQWREDCELGVDWCCKSEILKGSVNRTGVLSMGVYN